MFFFLCCPVVLFAKTDAIEAKESVRTNEVSRLTQTSILYHCLKLHVLLLTTPYAIEFDGR